jgi:hypothetical protein
MSLTRSRVVCVMALITAQEPLGSRPWGFDPPPGTNLSKQCLLTQLCQF